MNTSRLLIPAALLAASWLPLQAQEEGPIATPTITLPTNAEPLLEAEPVAPAQPAVRAGSAAAPIPADATSGTTIVGDAESPIGLYITPWKDDYAERGLDRPARLVDEAMEPIDPATFRRQIEYYETITAFRRRQQGAAK